jgi:hypothetical protein
MVKAACNKKTFYQQRGFNKFKEETIEVVHLEHSSMWCWKLGILESRSEVPREWWNVVLEKDGDQLDRSREKWRGTT